MSDTGPGELLRLLRTRKWTKIIMFCNTVRHKDVDSRVFNNTLQTATCIWLSRYLADQGIATILLHGELRQDVRFEDLMYINATTDDVAIGAD